MLFKSIATSLMVLLMSTLAFGATEAELKERFKQRYPQLQQLNTEGKLGETHDGRVDMPKLQSDAAVQQAMADENRDRAELYQIIAKQTQTTPDQVAARNGARNFEKARKGEWLKHADGQWRQK